MEGYSDWGTCRVWKVYFPKFLEITLAKVWLLGHKLPFQLAITGKEETSTEFELEMWPLSFSVPQLMIVGLAQAHFPPLALVQCSVLKTFSPNSVIYFSVHCLFVCLNSSTSSSSFYYLILLIINIIIFYI